MQRQWLEKSQTQKGDRYIFLKRNRVVPVLVLLTMEVALNGCVSTKHVAKDAVDAMPVNVDAVDKRTDSLTDAVLSEDFENRQKPAK